MFTVILGGKHVIDNTSKLRYCFLQKCKATNMFTVILGGNM